MSDADDGSSDEEDNIKIVLHQPDEVWDVGDEKDEDLVPHEGVDQRETSVSAGTDPAPVAAASGGGATPIIVDPIDSGASPAQGVRCSTTPHKKYVNPRLQATPDSAALGSGRSTTSRTPNSIHATHAAKRAKLGPLAHIPGGMDLELDDPLPDNIDVDSVQDKAWRRPESDLTDYFNYGFTEDTWRLYCHKQQACCCQLCALSF